MDNTIYSLNDDVLVEIFSYLDTDNLITKLYKVCEHWAHLISHDSRIWKNRWLVWNLSRSVNTMNKYLKRAPLLEKLKVVWVPRSNDCNVADSALALRNVLTLIPQALEVEISFPVISDILQYLNNNLVSLNVTNICNQHYSHLSRFKNLQMLKFGNAYDFCGRHLRSVCEECRSIKTIHLGDCRSLNTTDVIYSLKLIMTRIESLELNGYGLNDEVFVIFPQCKNLRELCIHDARLMRFSTFIEILHYSHIKVLHLSRLKLKYSVPVSNVKDRIVELNFTE
ncbi:hypothetical protein R5R35_012890 [Gryllus longicercus]|uniref:F-box domain-containing protein n=1 Tax=Gryllus longicercus TaxID=2509291 RepID=A0AAN9VQ69_9ORTH